MEISMKTLCPLNYCFQCIKYDDTIDDRMKFFLRYFIKIELLKSQLYLTLVLFR